MRQFLPCCLFLLISFGGIPVHAQTSEREKNPWTHLNFLNDPDNFQFAIVGDRTGGLRRGVFPNPDKVRAEWDEMEAHIKKLDMPFFYVPGNHDNGSPLLAKLWRERFGVERYFFVYKNVLFLCLNAQDTEQPAAVNPRPVFHLELTDQAGLRYVARKNLPVDFTDWYKKHDLEAPAPSPQELKAKKQAAQKKTIAEREARRKAAQKEK